MPAPWTFICPHCAGPAFHAIAIPRTAEAARALATAGGLDDTDGRRIEPDDTAACGTCSAGLDPSLTFAAMTVEANWQRREDPTRRWRTREELDALERRAGLMGLAGGRAGECA